MADEICAPPAIGIDLGTTFCCVGVYINGQVRIIPNLETGDFVTPSYVFFEQDEEEVVGNPAKANAYRNPENTIYDVKRILGREFTDPDLVNDMKFWPFTVKEDEGVPKVLVNGKPRYPEEISAKLLSKLKKFAEQYLKLEPGSIKKAVITVPAYFHDGQRQATIDAGELAELEVLTILNEPTAAAIAYSLETLDTKPKKILVFDLGGGTFDVAVLNIGPNQIEVLGVNGDTHLGGEDFDRKLMEHCAASFKTKTGIDLLKGKDSTDIKTRQNVRRNLRRLQTYCETAKIYVTTGNKAKVSVDVMAEGQDLVVDVTRAQFEEMNKAYFEKTIHLVDCTLKELGLSKGDIDDIIMVGGSTRIPKVQEMLTNYFDGKALTYSIHADQAVAYGAAIHAAAMTGDKSLDLNKISKLEDVIPIPLGIEVAPDFNLSVIIPKNTKVPTRKIKGFTTPYDLCTRVGIRIYQGNDLKIARNNRLLGSFQLGGIPSNKKGVEKLDVTMEINEMGILHIEAVCKSNQNSNSLTITEHKNRMSKETKQNLLRKEMSGSERPLAAQLRNLKVET